MTLETTVSKAVYTGNGATTEFPFSFKVWDEKQILVSVTDAQGYVQEAGEYSVTLSAGGGTVSYLHEGAPLPMGWKLALTRDMPFTQEDNYITGTRFDPEVIETALDKATAERQQLLEQLQRAVILPPTSDETPEDMAQELLRARDEAVQSAGAARNSEQAAAGSASDAAASEQAAAESVRQAEDWTERAQAWAESPTPPDPDDPESKSAKEWAKIASDTVPIATPAIAGKVKIGLGITIAPDGTISIPTPDEDFFRIIEGGQNILSLSAALASELAEQKALRLRDIGVPRYWRSTNLPPNHCWANGDFVEFADWPELEQVYNAGGFAGMLMAWDADSGTKAANLGKWRPDAANPTGLYTPNLSGQFFRNWAPGSGKVSGAWSPDSGRNLTGQVDYFLGTTSGGIASGCFSKTTQRPPVAIAEGQAHHQIVLNFDAATVWGEHAGAEFVPAHVWQPVCLYLGRPAQV